MSEPMVGNRRMNRDDGYAYRRRYLDESVWEPVDVPVVERALWELYWHVSLALDFLNEAGRIRTPVAMCEAVRV